MDNKVPDVLAVVTPIEIPVDVPVLPLAQPAAPVALPAPPVAIDEQLLGKLISQKIVTPAGAIAIRQYEGDLVNKVLAHVVAPPTVESHSGPQLIPQIDYIKMARDIAKSIK